MPSFTQFIKLFPQGLRPLLCKCFSLPYTPSFLIHCWSHRACDAPVIFLPTLLSNIVKYSQPTVLLCLSKMEKQKKKKKKVLAIKHAKICLTWLSASGAEEKDTQGIIIMVEGVGGRDAQKSRKRRGEAASVSCISDSWLSSLKAYIRAPVRI